MDTRTAAEKRYDAERSGSLYRKPELVEDDAALIEASNRMAAQARQAPTMRERVELLFEADHLPEGDEIFDLVLEDRVAHYVWLRCIDWVLWRLAHGKPVKVLAQPDRTSALIDARYSAARALSSNPASYRAAVTDADVHLLCAGEMIEKWERTPEQEAEIQRNNELIIKILAAIDGGE